MMSIASNSPKIAYRETQGRASRTMVFSHYAPVDPHMPPDPRVPPVAAALRVA